MCDCIILFLFLFSTSLSITPLSPLLCFAFLSQGGFLGIQLDASGRLAESSIGNVAILTPQGILRTPPFENILAGTTVKRLWELAEETLKPQGKKTKKGRGEGSGSQGEFCRKRCPFSYSFLLCFIFTTHVSSLFIFVIPSLASHSRHR